MATKIQLTHPAGKKAVSMDKEKYALLKEAILNCLKTKGELTHKELFQAVSDDFQKNKTKFSGSIQWNMEWVKLDLEAGKKIKRISDTSPVKYVLFR